ncbi:hypothetical protein DPMN_015955, partial [Dreissena polymorpha]
ATGIGRRHLPFQAADQYAFKILKKRRTQATSVVDVTPAPAFPVSHAAFQVPPAAKIRSRHWLPSRSPWRLRSCSQMAAVLDYWSHHHIRSRSLQMLKSRFLRPLRFRYPQQL